MFKRFLFCLAAIAMLLCAAAAYADAPDFDLNTPAYFVPSSDLTLPAGLALKDEPTYQDGVLSFTIDTNATDWYQAITSAYDSSTGEVCSSGVLLNPCTEKPSYKAITSTTASDEYLKNRIENGDWDGSSGNFYFSHPLGRYDADKELFIPYPPEDADYSIVIGWKDGTEIRRLRIRPRFTDYSPQPAGISLLPTDFFEEHLDEDLSPTFSDGKISYHRATPSSNPFITRFSLPQSDMGSWTVSDSSADFKKEDNSSLYAISTPSGSASESVKVVTYVLELRDASGNVHDRYSLTISIVQGAPLLWPEYITLTDEDFHPVPEGRIRVSLSEDVPGVKASYSPDKGHLRFELNAETFVPSAQGNLANLKAELFITPPDDAVFMRFRSFGSDVIYGQQEYPDYNKPDPYMPLENVEGKIWEEGYPFFREVPYESGEKSYFTSPLDYTGKYAGMVGVYYWFAASDEDPTQPAEEPLCIEYIARTHDPVTFVTNTKVIGDESEMTKDHLDKPFIVIQDRNHGYKDHTFFAKMYPTGEDRHYYELRVLNPNGKETPLSKVDCRLYLPYPPGYDETNAHLLHITIHHYNKKGDTIKDYYSLENGTITLTEHGLCIHVGDLSPFSLEWGAPADAALPETGDPSRPMLWLALLALAAFCLKKRCRFA